VKTLDRLSPWELLGLSPGASVEEIRHAYDRLAARLAPGSLALYSIADREEQSNLQKRLRAAFLDLMACAPDHAAAEAPQPQAVPADDARTAPPAAVSNAGDSARALTPEAEVDFGGDAIRRAREAKGISLDVLSHHTRIRRALLEAVEAERFAALPARVFVRGFVFAIAGQLGLDPEKVWASYGPRWEAWSATRQ